MIKIAKSLKHSSRGELEILDAVRPYMNQSDLHVKNLGRGFAWLDTGTFDSLSDATEYVRVIEKRQGLKIGCPEEIAYRMGFITKGQLTALAEGLKKSGYGEYLFKIVQ